MNEDKELFSIVPYSAKEAENTSFVNYSFWGSVFYNFFKKKMAVLMLVVFVCLMLMSFIIPPLTGFSVESLTPDLDKNFISPCRQYLFGTDAYGRDYWTLTWYSCGLSIKLAFTVAAGQLILGTILGLIWGYIPQSDGIFTAIYNTLDNIPSIIILTLVTMFVGQNFWVMAIALISLGWLSLALEIRNIVYMYRDREYNLASRCLGTPVYRILTKNILPYLTSVIVLNLALSIPATIATESTLSFLGLGFDVNSPTLGVLLKEAKNYFLEYPYLLLFPAVIVALISVTFYLAGNAFADATDPKNHR